MHAITAQDFKLRDEIYKLDVLKFRLIDFVLVGTHLFFRAAIEDIDFIRAEAYRGAAAVHRGKATTQNDDLFADKGGFAEVGFRQELDAVLNALKISPGDNLVIRAG